MINKQVERGDYQEQTSGTKGKVRENEPFIFGQSC